MESFFTVALVVSFAQCLKSGGRCGTLYFSQVTCAGDREAALADAALSLNIASSATEGLVAAVVEAVADDVVADLVAAGAAFTKAQAAAKTLAAHITGKGWFGIAERLNVRPHLRFKASSNARGASGFYSALAARSLSK